ncbi:MAG: hypothetical protein ACR2P4_08935 [Gammaproteobacteria bacterium]
MNRSPLQGFNIVIPAPAVNPAALVIPAKAGIHRRESGEFAENGILGGCCGNIVTD